MDKNDMARGALEMSVVYCCNRIDEIIRNDTNWVSSDKSKMAQELRKTLKGYRGTLKAQQHLAEIAAQPHKAFPPRLSRTVGEFIAVYQGLSFQVVGRGSSLTNAISDYDQQFDKHISKEQREQEIKAYQALEEAAMQPSALVPKQNKKKKP